MISLILGGNREFAQHTRSHVLAFSRSLVRSFFTLYTLRRDIGRLGSRVPCSHLRRVVVRLRVLRVYAYSVCVWQFPRTNALGNVCGVGNFDNDSSVHEARFHKTATQSYPTDRDFPNAFPILTLPFPPVSVRASRVLLSHRRRATRRFDRALVPPPRIFSSRFFIRVIFNKGTIRRMLPRCGGKDNQRVRTRGRANI